MGKKNKYNRRALDACRRGDEAPGVFNYSVSPPPPTTRTVAISLARVVSANTSYGVYTHTYYRYCKYTRTHMNYEPAHAHTHLNYKLTRALTDIHKHEITNSHTHATIVLLLLLLLSQIRTNARCDGPDDIMNRKTGFIHTKS